MTASLDLYNERLVVRTHGLGLLHCMSLNFGISVHANTTMVRSVDEAIFLRSAFFSDGGAVRVVLIREWPEVTFKLGSATCLDVVCIETTEVVVLESLSLTAGNSAGVAVTLGRCVSTVGVRK